MERGTKDIDARQYQSDARLARQPVSDLAFSDTSEVDALTLAMRQLMQLPSRTTEPQV